MPWFCINSPERHEKTPNQEDWRYCPHCGALRPLTPLEGMGELYDTFERCYNLAMTLGPQDTWGVTKEAILSVASEGMNFVRHLRRCWEAENPTDGVSVSE